MDIREERRQFSMLYGYSRGVGATISVLEKVAEECFENHRRKQRQENRRSVRPQWQQWQIILDSPSLGDWTSTLCPRSEQCERDCPGLRFRILSEWIQADSSYRHTMDVEMDERLICCDRAYQRWIDQGYKVRFKNDQHTRSKSISNVQHQTKLV